MHIDPTKTVPKAAAVLISLGLSCAPGASDRTEVPNAQTRAIVIDNDTRVFRYDLSAFEARPRVAMKLVEELRIDGRRESAPVLGGSGRPPQVAVSPDGVIFVLDSGGKRIHAFDDDGHLLRSFGRYGQGPGEFERPSAIVWVDDRLILRDDSRPGLLVAFDSVGTPLPSVRVDLRGMLLRATNDDAVLARTGAGGEFRRIDRISVSGGGQRTLAELVTQPVTRELFRATMQLFVERQMVWMTHARQGSFYLMGDHDYEIARVDLIAGVDWLLRVDWPARATGDADREYLDWLLDGVERRGLVPPDDWSRPNTLPALLTIRSDDRGLLYLFPADRLRRDPDWLEWRPRPVHVYSSDAALQEVGTIEMTPTAWQVVQNGAIYGARLDPGTLEWVVVKSRLARN